MYIFTNNIKYLFLFFVVNRVTLSEFLHGESFYHIRSFIFCIYIYSRFICLDERENIPYSFIQELTKQNNKILWSTDAVVGVIRNTKNDIFVTLYEDHMF